MNGTVIFTSSRSGSTNSGRSRKRLDDAEDVVPAPGVQAGRVLAQLVEDLVHLERRGQRLDEHRRADRAAVDAQGLLRVHEDVVPQPRLAVALHLGQVEVGARAGVEQAPGVVEEVQPGVEQAGGHRRPVDQHVLVVQVPAARAHEQRGGLLAEAVLAPVGAGELDRAIDRVGQVHVAVDHVGPRRRQRVLEVGHEPARAGVQRVDDHLAVDGPGDLDAAVAQVGRGWSDLPVALADLARLGQEVHALAGGQPRAPLAARGEQLAPAAVERAVQPGDERERLVGQHLGLAPLGLARQLDPGRVVVTASAPRSTRAGSGSGAPRAAPGRGRPRRR